MNIADQKLKEFMESNPVPRAPKPTFQLPLDTSDAWLKANQRIYTADQLRDLIARQRAAGLRTE